jgi:hypothetical protein
MISMAREYKPSVSFGLARMGGYLFLIEMAAMLPDLQFGQ